MIALVYVALGTTLIVYGNHARDLVSHSSEFRESEADPFPFWRCTQESTYLSLLTLTLWSSSTTGGHLLVLVLVIVVSVEE